LSPYCSKDDALEILRTTAAGINYEALLPAMNVSFSEVESVDGEAYYGEILAKDDPHGTYIGNETACCMRYDSWAPEAFTCIQAAYRWPNTGLFALYGSDGGIDAQSFFWKHPEHPNTLVLDSAEPLEGRQPERLRERYIQFWRRTLIEHAARDKSFPIRRVHIGGYDRMPLDGLQPTESIPALPGLYTDAETQLLLVEVTDEEIEAAIVEGPAFLNEVLERPHVTRIPTLSVKGNERLVVEMENRAYSPAQRGYGTPNDVKELMTLRSGADYSFISVDDEGIPTGYCLAQATQIPADGGYMMILKLEDLVSDPANLQPMTGMSLLQELLIRAENGGFEGIRANAQESTMYRFVTSPRLRRVVSRLGYEIIDEGLVPSLELDQDEEVYHQIFVRHMTA
jgi:hypothetical protein